MLESLHRSAGLFFFLLGSALIAGIAYMRYVEDTLLVRAIMSSLDLPLILSAVLYGGISVYRGMTKGRRRSRVAAVLIGVPLAAIFLLFAYLNFAFDLKTLA